MTQAHASFYRQWLDDNKVSRSGEYFDYKGQGFKLEYLNSKYYAVNLQTGREYLPSHKTKIEAIYRACIAHDASPLIPNEATVSIMMQALEYIEVSHVVETLKFIEHQEFTSQQRVDAIEAMKRVIKL